MLQLGLVGLPVIMLQLASLIANDLSHFGAMPDQYKSSLAQIGISNHNE
jgi:hypothetical protein